MLAAGGLCRFCTAKKGRETDEPEAKRPRPAISLFPVVAAPAFALARAGPADYTPPPKTAPFSPIDRSFDLVPAVPRA